MPADLRQPLKDLSAALIELHRALLRSAQAEYEVENGPVPARVLLQLVAFDPRFEWLRTVSEVIVELDERVADAAPLDPGTARAFRSIVEKRISSDDRGFLEKLRAALQTSTDVATGMGAVRMALRRLPEGGAPEAREGIGGTP